MIVIGFAFTTHWWVAGMAGTHHYAAVVATFFLLLALNLASGFQILQQDSASAIAKVSEPVDICFLDPPYKMEEQYEKVLTTLANASLLRENSMVIAEHSKHFDPREHYGRLKRFRKLVQGDAVLSFYRISNSSSNKR